MKRLIIIDGNAILHRAYHALPSLTNKKGEIVNAVYGFSSMLLRVIASLKPDYLVVAFDTPEPTFRNKMYKDYQATRPKAEDNLISQIDKVHKLVSDLEIASFAQPGYEADDVIGSLAFQAKKPKLKINPPAGGEKLKITDQNLKNNKIEEELETIIVTGDRDILQLVDENTKVYMPIKGLSESKLYGIEEVKEKYGLLPSQIADLKALTGDPSDNYPGVKGIGPKTAAFLLQNYQSLEGIYQAIKTNNFPVKIPNKVLTTLIDGYENALLCQKLAAIDRKAKINFDLEKARWHADNSKIEKVLGELGFTSLVKRVGNPTSLKLRGASEKQKKTADNNQLGLF